MNLVPTLSREQVRHRLTTLVSDIAKIPIDLITESSAFDGLLQMQSVAFVELQVAIEKEYNIEIDPVRIVELNDLMSITDYVYDSAVVRNK